MTLSIGLIREALCDPVIACYPDFIKAVSDVLIELERLRSERPYIVGSNDGFEAAIHQAAQVIEQNSIMDTAGGKVLKPRHDGDREGMHYAVAIRALSITSRQVKA